MQDSEINTGIESNSNNPKLVQKTKPVSSQHKLAEVPLGTFADLKSRLQPQQKQPPPPPPSSQQQLPIAKKQVQKQKTIEKNEQKQEQSDAIQQKLAELQQKIEIQEREIHKRAEYLKEAEDSEFFDDSDIEKINENLLFKINRYDELVKQYNSKKIKYEKYVLIAQDTLEQRRSIISKHLRSSNSEEDKFLIAYFADKQLKLQNLVNQSKKDLFDQ